MSASMHCIICLCKYLCESLRVFGSVCLYLCVGMKCIQFFFFLKRPSSSRSTEVIMDCSLAELQLQVTQLTSDLVSPAKNEPVHGSKAECEYNEYVCVCVCAEAYMRRQMHDGHLCIIKPTDV